MRQIRPRTSHPAVRPSAMPSAITADLRDLHQARETTAPDQERLRRQLGEVRQAVDSIMEQLSIVVDVREGLKVQLATVAGPPPPLSPEEDDRSIVPWGFYDDEL